MNPDMQKKIQEGLEILPVKVLLTRYKLTDMGNAERLVALYGKNIRYC